MKCSLCDADGAFKVRLRVFPWLAKCVAVCKICAPKTKEMIQEMRKLDYPLDQTTVLNVDSDHERSGTT